MPLSARMRKDIEDVVEEKLRERVATKEEFKALAAVVERLARAQADLAEAQARTEQRVEELAQAQARTEQRVEELAQAQARTEKRVEELAQAQARTEKRVEELAQAQARTEKRVEELARAQKATNEAVARLADAVVGLRQDLEQWRDQIGKLGARWGIYSEEAFRNAMKALLHERYGVTVEERDIGGRQVDLVVRNGKPVIVQITSSTTREDIQKLLKAAKAYRKETGEEPDLMLVTAFISARLWEVAREAGIRIESHE